MKETGVIRRIDELGRIVIPKEIRKNLKIREGDSVEIYISEGENIILKKYSALSGMEHELKSLVKTIYNQIHSPILLCDLDNVLLSEGKNIENYDSKNISSVLRGIIEKRRVYDDVIERIIVTQPYDSKIYVYPLIVTGDIFGAIIVLQNNTKLLETDKLVIEVMASFLINKLEVA